MTVSLGGGELTGIVIAVTFALNAWLVFLSKAGTRVDREAWFARLEKYHVPGLLLLLCIYLTQSRGALISVVAAFTILQNPKNSRRRNWRPQWLQFSSFWQPSARNNILLSI